MSLVIAAIFLSVALITLGICGGFIANSAARIADIPNYEQNSHLTNARSQSIWASIIAWITVALILIVAIIYIIYSGKDMGKINDIVTYVLFFITLVSVIIVGILSAMAASNIHSSGVTDNNLSYRQAVIAAVLGIIVFVLLLIAFVIRVTYKVKKLYFAKTGRTLNIAELKQHYALIRQAPLSTPILDAPEREAPVVSERNSSQRVISKTSKTSSIKIAREEQENFEDQPEEMTSREEIINPDGTKIISYVTKPKISNYDVEQASNIPRRSEFNSESSYLKSLAKYHGYDVPDYLANIAGNIGERVRQNYARRNP